MMFITIRNYLQSILEIAGNVMVFTLVKLNGGFIIGKYFKAFAKNGNNSAIANHVKITGHNDHVGSL